ncbi:hypothetical protein [Neochlamydia sp. AcF95]|uniref:hypothetical protein n=1 Tax=Neochlamydia sp. AcF95 TaxID=2795734 RepID=UPI001BC9C877|nr:hypothetical protein [Neochlamydia sp. AcF95]
MRRIRLLVLVFLCACTYKPQSESYRLFYRHLEQACPRKACEQISPYFLVVLVEARHLDYSCPRSFFKTLAKHPSDGTKNGDVGHAWIYLQGALEEGSQAEGSYVFLEGGHSGELGYMQPRYMEGVFLQAEKGEKNPIGYLWQTQQDGFFQYGPGCHYPTFAAKINLTAPQFHLILKFIKNYSYSNYAIIGNQCCSFAAQAAALAGLFLDSKISLKIDPFFHIGSNTICLWEDPFYSQITFFSPDVLEKSLMQAVAEGRAEEALTWYKKKYPFRRPRWRKEDFFLFPQRYLRLKAL